MLDRLAEIVGPAHLFTSRGDMAPYLAEWRGLYLGETLAVVRPGTTDEVAAVVKAAGAFGLRIVPQGGNTGLVGGQIPFDPRREIVLSTTRLNRIRDVVPTEDLMVVEAGVTLLAAQRAADAARRLFPLSLAAEGSCTIGGVVATNAGGTAVLAYGTARDLAMGLEVVLADGRVWNGLGRLRKDNTGYDLKNIFVGSEGTLGVVTAAVLKLFPRPRGWSTGFCAVPSPAAALDLLGRAKERAGRGLTTFELMQSQALDFVLRHTPDARAPLAGQNPWYVLIELSDLAGEGVNEALEAIMADGLEAGLILDGAIATSLLQRSEFWRLRENMSEVQAHEGGSIKHDISVPLAALPAFIEEATAAVVALAPGCRPAIFGHLGDGNLHFNVSQPPGADKTAYLGQWKEMNATVHSIALSHGGSISAEHGIGLMKRDLLGETKDSVALDLMYGLKALFDPAGIFNPGKLLRAPFPTEIKT